MKHRLPLLFVAIGLLLVGGNTLAYAQEAMMADIPYKFVAGGQTHEAGRYELKVSEDQMGIMLTPQKGTANAILVLTRLAAPETPMTDGRLVFDKVGETYFLSEAWFPGFDGFALHSTKEKHTHHAIRLFRKK